MPEKVLKLGSFPLEIQEGVNKVADESAIESHQVITKMGKKIHPLVSGWIDKL